ncbi:MAG: hypothetical protein AB7E51_10035 [Pseudodesulfovibrio sp.]|uniref:hypothetical protein n=1 Tax=Pseudodesulfovibrio sp. TaxID=2035812 RepID=UPI003D0ADE24
MSATDGLGREGLKRAQRVYATTEYRRSKPSYRKRLIQYPDTPRKKNYPYTHVDQIACIAKDLASKPGYSCLSFTVLRPSDLIDKFRPGYVPCLTAGDFKFRNNKLNLNVLFRTCDALMLGFHDIYYMRLLQNEVLCMAKELTNNEKLLAGEIGELNIYFSRIFINKYIKSKNSTSMGVDIAKQVIQALRSP